MKSLIYNSNDRLLQLVSIQLLQKAYFIQLMFEGENYSTVSVKCIFLPAGAGSGSVLLLSGNFRIWQQSWRTERHQLKEAAHRAVQPCHELHLS